MLLDPRALAIRLLPWLQEVQLVVRDVSEPTPLALPAYKGEVYVFLAVAMGGVFTLAAAALLVACTVIHVGL